MRPTASESEPRQRRGRYQAPAYVENDMATIPDDVPRLCRQCREPTDESGLCSDCDRDYF